MVWHSCNCACSSFRLRVALAQREVCQLVESINALVVDLGAHSAQQVGDAPVAEASAFLRSNSTMLWLLAWSRRARRGWCRQLSRSRPTKAQARRSLVELASSIVPTARRFAVGLGALRRRLPSAPLCPARPLAAASCAGCSRRPTRAAVWRCRPPCCRTWPATCRTVERRRTEVLSAAQVRHAHAHVCLLDEPDDRFVRVSALAQGASFVLRGFFSIAVVRMADCRSWPQSTFWDSRFYLSLRQNFE